MTEGTTQLDGLSATERWTRRRFLQATGAAATVVAAGSALAACGGGGPAASPAKTPVARAGAKIRLLQWSSFVPASDQELIRQANEFGAQNQVEVKIETVRGDDLDTKVAAAVEAGDGPDIIQMRYAQAHLYETSCLDMTNEFNLLKSRLGDVDSVAEAYCNVKGTYRAVPYTFVPNAWVYRTDYFQKAGITQFPKTWDELVQAGLKLKNGNLPLVAQALGHAYGDATTMWYPVLWSFGGKEVSDDGKTVAINSKETEDALNWAIDAWNRGALSQGTLAWLDPDNNQAYDADKISATLNGASIYIKAVNTKKFDTVSDHATQPAGPKGTFTINLAWSHSVMKWSKDPETAKAFLLYLMDKANYSKWLGVSRGYNAGLYKAFENDPVWSTDPKIKPFRDVIFSGKWPGWPAKPSKASQRVITQYTITDMFARAVKSRDAKAEIRTAEAELKRFYERPS